MSEGNKIFTNEKPNTVSFWRSRNIHSTTTETSPIKTGDLLNRTHSLDRSYFTEHAADPNKKSIYEVKYFLQVHHMKQRNALISQKFEESNLSPQLSHNTNNKGMKGSKLQNKRTFRRNKFVQYSEIGCMEPAQTKAKASSGMIARHNKPNLMYNLDLFRKKHSRVIDPRHAELPKKKSFDSLAVESKKEGMQLLTRRKIRSVKTQQDCSKLRTLSERQNY